MIFEFRRRRFHLRARDPLYFPPGKAANILRGGLGCVLRGAEAYRRIFAPVGQALGLRGSPGPALLVPSGTAGGPAEPRPSGSGPSGFADPPRPFVLRASHLDGCRVAPGGLFHFDVHLFDLGEQSVAVFDRAFGDLAAEGLGPGRGRAVLDRVEELTAPPIALDVPEPARAVCVRFLTPTELKCGEALVDRPEFAVLFARLRDRISTLRAWYGPGPLDIDFRAMGERAAGIRMTRCELRHARIERRSTRTGQVHPLGGFTGEAYYEGDLGEFIPYLRAGHWTGVGRQTVWGKGEISVDTLAR